MKFIIGIGNPGKKYEKTRHNVGFEVLEGLAGRCKVQKSWKESQKLQAFAAGIPEGLLIKPLTFVNRTGECAARIVEKYTPGLRELLFVCDDVNLDFGKLRLRESGSAGGHHGLESVIAALGSEEFARLRFGVRNAGMPKDLNGFVLEKFDENERAQTAELLERAVSVCESWMKDGFEAAQKRLSQLQR